MTQIHTLKQNGESIYPMTHMKAVVDDNGNTMDVLLSQVSIKTKYHEDSVATIEPNVLNIWGEVANLDITLKEPIEGIINEYMFQFTSGATATTLVLPDTIKWFSAPNIQANKTYQVSIINNLGVIGEFNHE